jgi:hypothetical protein
LPRHAVGPVAPRAVQPPADYLGPSSVTLSGGNFVAHTAARAACPTKYFKLLARFRFAHLRSILFDQMLPRIAHYWTQETVVKLMTKAGLEDIDIAPVNEMSWSAIGRRPRRSTENSEEIARIAGARVRHLSSPVWSNGQEG